MKKHKTPESAVSPHQDEHQEAHIDTTDNSNGKG